MAGSLTKVEAFASQTWLKIQLLETLAKVGGLDNCSLLVSKQLKVLIMNVVPINWLLCYITVITHTVQNLKNNARPHINFL